MICRLCLKSSEEYFGFFDAEGLKRNASLIVGKHFWFEPKPDDIISCKICRICWKNIEDFHKFYVEVENAEKNYCGDKIYIKKETDSNEEECIDENYIDELNHKNDELCDADGSGKNEKNENESLEVDSKNEDNSILSVELTKFIEPSNSNDKNKKIKLNIKQKKKIKKYCKKMVKPVKIKKSSEEQSLKYKKIKEEDDIIEKVLRLSCKICSMEMKNFSYLKKHFTVVHKQNGYAVCCNLNFFKRTLLVDHIEKHFNPEKFKCSYCGKVYNTRFTLRIHIAKVHENLNTYKCIHPGCEKVFKRRETFQHHQMLHIPNEKRKYKCLQCEKRYIDKWALDCHIRIVHDGIHGGVCDICGKMYKNKKDAEKHRFEVHEGGEKRKYKCKLCSEEFSSRYHHNLHKIEVHSNGKSNETIEHKCTKCNKISPNSEALRSHIEYMHLTKAKLQCNICNKVFKRNLVLKEHMATHTGQALYTCPYCPKTFTHSANMHHHRKRIHPKEFQEAKDLKDEKKGTWCELTALK